MLELAILGLLKERAMHGYQLKKRLADTLGSFWQVSYGSLYPALRRLQREGAVEMIFPKEEVGRRKNVYRITEKGEALFAELLERAGHEATEDNGFSVRLAFFQYLKPETRHPPARAAPGLPRGAGGSDLKHRCRGYRERIDSYTLSLMNHELATTETRHPVARRPDPGRAAADRTARGPAPPRPASRRARRPPRPSGLPQKERA